MVMGLVMGWLWVGYGAGWRTDPPRAALTIRCTDAGLQPPVAPLAAQMGGEVEAAVRSAVLR